MNNPELPDNLRIEWDANDGTAPYRGVIRHYSSGAEIKVEATAAVGVDLASLINGILWAARNRTPEDVNHALRAMDEMQTYFRTWRHRSHPFCKPPQEA